MMPSLRDDLKYINVISIFPFILSNAQDYFKFKIPEPASDLIKFEESEHNTCLDDSISA